MFSCSAAWETWPAIASAWSCASAAERVGVLGGELLAVGLLLAQVARRSRASSLERWPVCSACSGSASAITGSHVVVDQHEAAEDVGDVLQARGGDEAPSRVAFSPAMKREFFQASKYSDIVGVMTTSAVSASCSVGSHSCAEASSSFGLLVEVARRGDEEVGVGQRLAELDLAVAVEVGSTPLAANFGSVP